MPLSNLSDSLLITPQVQQAQVSGFQQAFLQQFPSHQFGQFRATTTSSNSGNAYANPAAVSSGFPRVSSGYTQGISQGMMTQPRYTQQYSQAPTAMWNMELNKDLNGLLQDFEQGTSGKRLFILRTRHFLDD